MPSNASGQLGISQACNLLCHRGGRGRPAIRCPERSRCPQKSRWWWLVPKNSECHWLTGLPPATTLEPNPVNRWSSPRKSRTQTCFLQQVRSIISLSWPLGLDLAQSSTLCTDNSQGARRNAATKQGIHGAIDSSLLPMLLSAALHSDCCTSIEQVTSSSSSWFFPASCQPPLFVARYFSLYECCLFPSSLVCLHSLQVLAPPHIRSIPFSTSLSVCKPSLVPLSQTPRLQS